MDKCSRRNRYGTKFKRVVTKIAEPRRLFLSAPSGKGKGTPLSQSPGPDFIDLRNIESRVSLMKTNSLTPLYDSAADRLCGNELTCQQLNSNT